LNGLYTRLCELKHLQLAFGIEKGTSQSCSALLLLCADELGKRNDESTGSVHLLEKIERNREKWGLSARSVKRLRQSDEIF
jgi:hypothetical protein